ncbi:MAG: transposase domain-containing protein [Pseudomonadota bacterium]
MPDLPGTGRRVTALAEREGWRSNQGLARRRPGRGGGWEYHIRLFPTRAQAQLMAADAEDRDPAPRQEKPAPSDAWAVYERLPEKVKAKAEARLAVIQSVEILEQSGSTRADAVGIAARINSTSPRTIWNWLSSIEAVPEADRLPYLAPRHRTAKREIEKAELSPHAWEAFKTDYLRPERPTLTSAYRRVARLAEVKGWDLPSQRTLERRVKAEIPPATVILAREGAEALKRRFPPQIRDKSDLQAMTCVNADGHKWDVFVRWPDGTVGRPLMVAFQDVYSGRILSWRTDQTENRLAVMLAFGDMIETFGIPDHCVLDNGRAFASKWVTGGIPNRYRFKVKADDPVGVMPKMGVKVHWTIPYSGRSKPIERAFRDLCDDVAKDPRFAGAYVGNRPDAKPENYGATAVPLDVFEAVVAEGIAEHNARSGRRSAVCKGRSFVEAFEESYQTALIRKASAEQRRWCLMAVDAVTPDRNSGAIRFQENAYWAEWSPDMAGQKVVIRFDPAALHDGIHVEKLTGEYVGHAACIEKVGFLSLADAQTHAREGRRRLRAEREALDASRKMNIAELARELDAIGADETPPPAPKVVRPMFAGSAAAAAAAEPTEEFDAADLIDRRLRGAELRLVASEE